MSEKLAERASDKPLAATVCRFPEKLLKTIRSRECPSPMGGRSWLFMRTPKGGKRKEMGLGPYPAVSLAKARAKASEYRIAVADGRNPLAEKRQTAEPTCADYADQFVESIESEWRNQKHRQQWVATLSDAYCKPIREMRVSTISTEDVLSVLSPIWQAKSETASRLRGRIERVLDFAKAKGWRSGENPAAWRGHLRNVLPKRQKLARGHHAAMSFDDVSAFMTALKASEAMAARALELTILTASRTGETLGALWSEIDFEKKLWTRPKERMKAGSAHVVPLSTQAPAILKELHEVRQGALVFPGQRADKPLSGMAMECCFAA